MTIFKSVLTLEGLPSNGILKLIGNDPITDPNSLSLTTEASISFRSAGVPDGDPRQWLMGTNVSSIPAGAFGISTADLTATPFVIVPSSPGINYVGINNPAPAHSLDVIGSLQVKNGNIILDDVSGTLTVKPSATTSTYSLTLPPDAGTAGYVLSTDGTGVTSWILNGSGGGTTYYAGTGLTLTGTTFSVTTNGITDSLFRQSAGLSVVGNATNTTANVSDITGTANQVLIVNSAGTSLSFGAVNLASASVTGTLPVTNGGTGTNLTFTQGSVIFVGALGIYSQDNTKFFWDDINHRLGIGNNSPAYALDITGDINTSATLRMPTTSSGSVGVLYSGGNSFLHNFGTNNVYLGKNSANFTLTGNQNTAVGNNTLTALSSGSDNTAIGYLTMSLLTSGSENTSVGSNALQAIISGSGNTAVGYTALLGLQSGLGNTAVGQNSMSGAHSGSRNTALGINTLAANVSGSSNTSVGAHSSENVTSGNNNTVLGYQVANAKLSTGSNNILIGVDSTTDTASASTSTAIGIGQGVTPGTTDVAIGYRALNKNSVDVGYNVAIGYQSMAGNAFGNSAGHYNTAVGALSLVGNTTGIENTAFGYGSLHGNSTGSYNTALGWDALYQNNGNYNTSIGTSSLFNNQGNNNVALGNSSLNNNVSGNESTAIGYFSMSNANNSSTPFVTYNTALGAFSLQGSSTPSNNTGIYNTAIGHSALMHNDSGSNNVAVGYAALLNIGTDNNIGIGYLSLANTAINANYNIAIGTLAGQYLGTSSNGNVAVGHSALNGAFGTTGLNLQNTAIGSFSLSSIGFGGAQNTALGYDAGSAVTSGSNNTLIGCKTGFNALGVELSTGSFNILIGPSSGGGIVTTPASSTNNYLSIGNIIKGDLTSGNVSVAGTLSVGNSSTPTTIISDASSTYNFNLPTTAGSAGQVLTSQGGGASPMTWSNAAITNVGTTGQVAYYAANGSVLSGESLSNLIDASIDSTQGDILYRGATGWTFLTPGTSGQFLQTNGAAANPVWAAVSGASGGTVTSIIAGTGLTGGTITSSGTIAIDSTVVTLAGSQTLTNKTLTSPTFTSPVLGTPASGNLANCTFPTLNQNTTGTSANITATTNSTLTTLSALSLPYSQLSGTIPTWNQNTTGQSGTVNSIAGNISAGTNITLTGAGTIASPYVVNASGGASGTVTSVTFTGDGTVLSSTPSSAVTTTGTLTATLATQSANKVLAGPTTGSATPTFRSLVGADLPNPSSVTLGGVQSIAAVTSKWINSISTAGVPSLTQPAFTDISGNISVSQMNSGTGASSSTYWRGDGTWVAVSAGSGTVNSGAIGQVAFYASAGTTVSGAGTGTTELYWDNTNHRLGVNNTSPAYPLDVTGAINTTTTYDIGGAAVLSTPASSTNIAVGGSSTTGGAFNTAVGYSSMISTSGNANVAIGYSAGSSLTSANNTIIGSQAGLYVSSGTQNTIVGHRTGGFGTGLQTGSYNILIGPTANASTDVTTPTSSTNNYLSIGNVITGDLSTGNIAISGALTTGGFTVIRFVSSAPASSSASGTKGDYFVDASNAYFCIAANTWVKTAVISSF